MSLWYRFQHFWRWFNHPEDYLEQPKVRYRSRVLFGLVQLLPPIIIISTFTIVVLSAKSPHAQVWHLSLMIGGVCLALFCYLLSRLGYDRSAASLIVVVSSIAAHLNIVNYQILAGIDLTFLVIPIILSAAILPYRYTTWVALGNIGIFLVMGLVVYDFEFQGEFLVAFTFLIISLMIILILTRERDNLEEHRREILAQSENRYRRLVELSPDAIVVYSPPQLLYANPMAYKLFQQTTSASPAELWAHLTEETRQTLVNLIQTQHKKGEIDQSLTLAFSNGQRMEVSLLGTGVNYDDKPAWQLILRDITMIRENEKQALALAQALEQNRGLQYFVQAISHDIKTPLTVVKTALYLAQKLQTNPPKQTDQIVKADKAIDYMTRVIDDLLSLSRLEVPETYTLEPVPLHPFLRDTVNQIRDRLTRKELHLDMRLSEPEMVVQMDKVLFHEACLKLLKNSITFTPAGGKLTISTQQSDHHAQIILQDTGVGISEEDLPHIFEPFFRADKARNLQEGHAGLGLTIAKKIIDHHQGTVEITSTLGEGTILTLTLPLAPQP